MINSNKRLVKGVYLLGLVKQLKIWKREAGADRIPDLDPEDQRDLFEGRIMLSSWYPLEQFWRVLDLAFKLPYGESPEGLNQMGIDSANVASNGPQRLLIKPGNPARSLEGLPVYWSLSYNFGAISVTKQKKDFCVALNDYPDVPLVHALLHVGFISQILTLTGTPGVVCEATAFPWKSADSFRLSVTWQGLE